MDEKAPLLRPLLRRDSGSPRWEILLSIIATACFISLGTIIHNSPNSGQGTFSIDKEEFQDGSAFSWKQIPPSRTLQWHPCFSGGFDCARLDVPVNWQQPREDDRVILAIARLRATNTTDYRGPVFFNPGGPGGSGIWALRDHGAHLQTIVGRNHDLVTFDPRGVGASVPRIECWDSTQSRHNWAMQETPVLDSHPGVLYDAWARATGFSMACEEARGAAGLLEHVGTASHARDMLEVLTQLGEDRLRYWGFSYGTILGGTFAAMYPDRVERLVSDGNVDYEEWYNGAHVNSVRDADAVMEAFYELCHAAGPEKCAFYGPSPGDIRTRHLAILERLRVQPVIYMPNKGAGAGPVLPELVTYSKIRKLTATSLYRPNYYFAHLARILAALETGDGAAYYAFVTQFGQPFSDVCTVERVPPTEPRTSDDEGSDDAFPAILCADRAPPLPRDPRAFAGRVAEMQAVSRTSGAIVARDLVACAGRAVRPRWAFRGPFRARTGFPVLFVANMADNITPLVSARNNSAGFEDSVVLIQNSYGVSWSRGLQSCSLVCFLGG